MNNLAKTLLAGSALCALTTAPAMAQNVPAFPVTALHAGHLVKKTRVHNPGRTHLTYTFAVYSYVPASDLNTKVILPSTIEKFAGSCPPPNFKIKLSTKKTEYAKLGIAMESYSDHCSVGVTYKLTDPNGEGKTDSFVASLITKYQHGGVKYKGTLNLDLSVGIGK